MHKRILTPLAGSPLSEVVKFCAQLTANGGVSKKLETAKFRVSFFDLSRWGGRYLKIMWATFAGVSNDVVPLTQGGMAE